MLSRFIFVFSKSITIGFGQSSKRHLGARYFTQSSGISTVRKKFAVSDFEITAPPRPASSKSLMDHPLVGKCEQQFKDSSFEDCIATCQNILKEDNKIFRVHYLLGLCYVKMHEGYSEAKHHFERCVEIDPRSAPGHYYLALCEFGLDKFEQALSVANHVLQLDQSHWNALFLKGQILCKLGRYEESLECFTAYPLTPTTAESDKRYSCALTAAQLYRKLGYLEESLTWYEKALKLGNQAGAYQEKAAVFSSLKDDISALDTLNRYLFLDPYHISTLFMKVEVLKSAGKYEEALETCDKYLRLDSTNFQMLCIKAQLLHSLRRSTDFVQLVEWLSSIRPNDYVVSKLKIKAFTLHGFHQEAAQLSAEIERYEKQQLQDFQNVAELAFQCQNYGIALEHYRSALRFAPHNPHLIAGQAASMIRSSDVFDAEKQLVSVLDEFPDHFLGNLALGELKLSQKRFHEAANHLEIALASDKANLYVMLKLALALQGNQNFTTAEELARSIVESTEDDEFVRLLKIQASNLLSELR